LIEGIAPLGMGGLEIALWYALPIEAIDIDLEDGVEMTLKLLKSALSSLLGSKDCLRGKVGGFCTLKPFLIGDRISPGAAATGRGCTFAIGVADGGQPHL
jgi:hypothetical protein